MTKGERVDFIIHKLEELYPHPEIPLDHKDAYTMLISVLLSALLLDSGIGSDSGLLVITSISPIYKGFTEVERKVVLLYSRASIQFSPLIATSLYNSSQLPD